MGPIVPKLTPEELRQRLRRAVVVAVLLAAFLWLAWSQRQSLATRDAGPAAALCQATYRRALTARDSALVDAQHPMLPGEDAPDAQTCGELRREGKLSP